jgi:hypothetical protein
MVTSYALTTRKLAFEIIDSILEKTTSCMDQCFSGVFLTFNNKNNSLNNSYSNIRLPCRIICKTVANCMNLFRVPKWIPTYIKVMTNSEFHIG